jgi:peptidylprolyl isomerase
MFAPATHLNGQYTIVGQVESGMEHVDAIARGNGPNGSVSRPDRMIRVRIASDAN